VPLPLPTLSPRIGESGPIGQCADFSAALDRRITKAGVVDPGAFRVSGQFTRSTSKSLSPSKME
jgi:hypothetical protein